MGVLAIAPWLCPGTGGIRVLLIERVLGALTGRATGACRDRTRRAQRLPPRIGRSTACGTASARDTHRRLHVARKRMLRVARCVLHVARCKALHVARCTPIAACCMLQVACSIMQAACWCVFACCMYVLCCMLHVARCMLHAARRLLHSACCMWHACCTSHVARCTFIMRPAPAAAFATRAARCRCRSIRPEHSAVLRSTRGYYLNRTTEPGFSGATDLRALLSAVERADVHARRRVEVVAAQ